MLTGGFLLFLQAFRESSGAMLNSFLMSCTDMGNLPIILFLIGALYWCYDKKLGEYLLVSLSFARIVTSFTKLTVCEYRPWISNPKIHPYEEALEGATGYSFPSGHATSSTVLFIGTCLRGKVTKGLKIFLVICLFLICFSRCYLGVHSLEDIIVGIVLSFIVLFIVGKVFDKYEDNPKFDLIILAAGIILSVLFLVYAMFKSYPMNYDSAGKLIVDPAKMSFEAFKDFGFSVGTLLSWVIERRFVKFSCEGPIDCRILRVAGAYLGYLVLMHVMYPLIKGCFAPQVANFINFFMFPFYVVLLVPVIIKFFQNRKKDVYCE